MSVRIVFVGQLRWAETLAALVNRLGNGASAAAWSPGVVSLPPIPAIRQAHVFVRVGFRPGATTARGVALEMAWGMMRRLNPRARVAYYWIGSDVTTAIRAFESGRVLRWTFNESLHSTHLAGAPWFTSELATIGIAAEELLFPSPLDPGLFRAAYPKEFRVLSYIPDSRFRSYGGPHLESAASALPNVVFDVVGGKGDWSTARLPNLRFHGTVADMVAMYERTAVVVRLVDHDALGATVREGLAAGRRVIYSYQVPHVMHLPFSDGGQLCDVIGGLADQHRCGGLMLDRAAREFARDAFDERELTRRLVNRLALLAQKAL